MSKGSGWHIVDEGPVADEATSPGARLKAVREKTGWTRKSFAAELKLTPERLEQLESDDFAAFGPPVFVRGYLRRCATLLEIPPNEILELYEAVAGANAPPVEIGLPPGRPPRADRSGLIGSAMAVAAIAAVLAGGWWFFGPSGGEPVARRPAQEELAPLTIEPPEAESTPIEEDPSVAEAPPAREPAPASPETESSAASAQVPVTEPDAADTVEDALAAAGPASPAVVPVETPVIPAGQADIRVELLEDCWLEIIDAEGRRLAYRLGRAGEVTRVRGTAPVSVFLGNAEGVELTVDGEPVAVRPAARRDGTARLTVGGGAG